MPYFVYILKCSDQTLYTGYTNNLEKRLEHHNNSKQGAHYTKIRRPVKLLYSETFPTLKEALRREYAIKKLTREEKLNLIKNNYRLT
ncbi:MAG: GIY-YIG nuclease family protein [Patescibacteria group bacterium]